ncbi:MAG: ABC transporter substrate-binding protein [Anaerolineaceae bacterium]|nr:ABC transporter substrate-binding protein [Anaerolineaceae bacterium]
MVVKHHFSLKLIFTLIVLLLTSIVGVAQEQYTGAPMLDDLVADGTLPPVDERLPANPLVVEPIEAIGQYGGTWRTGLRGGTDHVWLQRTIGYDQLVRWDMNWENVIPNVAESFEFNDEGTEFTFHLREGMKWSDGAPFTAEDIRFYVEDLILYEDENTTSPGVPGLLRVGPETFQFEVVDDYTVKFIFSAPNGLFMQRMARGDGASFTAYPKHYFEQFHPLYNENVDDLVAEAGVADWRELMTLRGGAGAGVEFWQNAGIPTLNAWVITTPYGTGTQVVAERNPYYFKVDPEGQQLPYLDRVQYTQFEDVEIFTLAVLNGEIDMQDRHINTITNRAVLFDGQEAGDYHFYSLSPDIMNTTTIMFNFTHPDPMKREIFQNKDFRAGLSHAINRQEIIDLIYIGQGEPWQAAPRPEAPFYNEEFGKQFTEYDPELASEYLDKVLPEKDADGYRLGPDGNRFSFVITVSDAPYTENPSVIEQVVRYLQEAGVDAQFDVVDRALLTERQSNNQHDAWIWAGGGGLDNILNPSWYVPVEPGGATIGRAWEVWYANSSDPLAEEPPQFIKDHQAMYDALSAEPNPERQAEMMRELLEYSKDQFYVIGINLMPMTYGIVKNNFRNVPPQMFDAVSVLNPGYTNTFTYFFDDSM